MLCADHGALLANAVNWATNEPAPVTVSGSGLLDVTLWRQPDALTVHLVNLTNPMTMKGPFRELIPVGQQTVRLRLPPNRKARTVRLLAADRAAKFSRSGLGNSPPSPGRRVSGDLD